MKKKLTVGLLRCVARLPLPALYLLSDVIYFFIYHVIGYRRRVTMQNLREAFPEKTIRELHQIEKDYYHFLAETIVETVKLLHISPANMARRVRISNPEAILDSVRAGRNVVLMLGHYGNWEWVQEMSRCLPPDVFMATIYHPLKSHLWDEVYKEIRSRWNVNVIPQDHAVKALLNPVNKPWVCGFIADHRPLWITEDNIVPFLNHHTSFIYGPEVIGKKTGADFFFLEMDREKRGHYSITFRQLAPQDDDHPYTYTREFWRLFEEQIRRRPAFWLWSHKRWKRDRLISN